MRHFRVFLLILLSTTPTWAWWDQGHRIVAFIAQDHLVESCQETVTELLRHHPDPSVRTLDEAAVWADLIKDKEHPFHAHSRPDWHYWNAPNPETAEQKTSGQLVEQIRLQGAILADPQRTKEDRALALSWYVHLVGDVHQPLHNASHYSEEFPKGDRGGNLFFVLLNERRVSLHALWDSAGARFGENSLGEPLSYYTELFSRTWPRSRLGPELEIEDPEIWSQEGLSITLETIYPNVQQDTSLSSTAFLDTLIVTERQISLAGYRLAEQLNKRL